jgi:hypothetical protein
LLDIVINVTLVVFILASVGFIGAIVWATVLWWRGRIHWTSNEEKRRSLY